MRTPLTTLYGAARLLARPTTTGIIREELVDAVTADAARLVRFLDDLLAMVEATADGVRTEPVLVQRVLAEVTLAVLSDHPRARVKVLAHADLAAVAADPGALRHALGNVLRHAIGVSTRRATVEVVVHEVAGWVVISVFDRPAVGSTGMTGQSLMRHPGEASEPGGRLWLASAEALVVAMGGRVALLPHGDGHEVRMVLPHVEVD